MNYVALTEKLVKALVIDADMVTVKEFPSDDPKRITIEVLVSEKDLPRLIGKGGRTANAIRQVLKASSSLHDHKYISINIESF